MRKRQVPDPFVIGLLNLWLKGARWNQNQLEDGGLQKGHWTHSGIMYAGYKLYDALDFPPNELRQVSNFGRQEYFCVRMHSRQFAKTAKYVRCRTFYKNRHYYTSENKWNISL